MAFSIPTNTIAAQLAWMETFIAEVAADPATYFVDPADVTDMQNAITAFRNAYDVAGVVGRVAVDPAGYTKPGRAALYSARDAAMLLVENWAGLIQSNAGISDMDKLDAGVQPRTTTRTPIPLPSSNPVIGLLLLNPGVAKMSIADSDTPALKAKPYGIVGCELAANIDTVVDSNPANASVIGIATRTPHMQTFSSGDAGKVATVFGRWLNNRGEKTSWSAPVNFVIA